MALLSGKDTLKVKEILETLPAPVDLHFFTQELECQFCQKTHALLRELADLSSKIKVVEHDFVLDKDAVETFSIQQVPAIAPVGPKGDLGIRLYGIPAGYEFATLLEALKLAAGQDPELTTEAKTFIKELNQKLEIDVYVTPTCPYCPGMVLNAFRFAAASPHITGSMVEATEFPHLAIRYQVRGVPRTVINKGAAFVEGLVLEGHLVEALREALTRSPIVAS